MMASQEECSACLWPECWTALASLKRTHGPATRQGCLSMPNFSPTHCLLVTKSAASEASGLVKSSPQLENLVLCFQFLTLCTSATLQLSPATGNCFSEALSLNLLTEWRATPNLWTSRDTFCTVKKRTISCGFLTASMQKLLKLLKQKRVRK